MRYSAAEHLDDLAAIVTAGSHDALQYQLVLRPPALGVADPYIPIGAFRQAQAAGSDGAIDTFVLIATDPRWSSNAHEVIGELVATELVEDRELDVVAEAFVRAGREVDWACPEHWYDDWVGIDISLTDDDEGDDGGHDDDEDGDDVETDGTAAPTLVRREIPRGTRRWAAERVIRRDIVAWDAMIARVDELPAKQGAPILHGMLDAADHLPEPTARVVDRRGADSGDVAVRLAALGRIASYDRDEALRRGATDANRRVRRWADSGGRPERPASPEDGGTLF